METTAQKRARRRYARRSDDERIADLERRIADLKSKQSALQKKDDPVLREIPKIQRRLRKFAQLAMDHNRPDISNSIMAFNAGMERILHSELKRPQAGFVELEG
jgi:predicted site-specific integrase-resolvase